MSSPMMLRSFGIWCVWFAFAMVLGEWAMAMDIAGRGRGDDALSVSVSRIIILYTIRKGKYSDTPDTDTDR